MENLEKELYSSAITAFEELAFMFEMPELEDEDLELPFDGTGMVTFTGPINGRLYVSSYGGLMRSMAVNILGEDEPTKEQQKDVLGEMANVICGNVLPRIAGRGHIFRIGPPQFFSTRDESLNSAEENITRVRIPLNEGVAEVSLSIAESN